MKIDSSNVFLTSQRSLVEKDTLQESLKVWIGSQRPDSGGGGRRIADIVSISPQAQTIAQADGAQLGGPVDPAKGLEKDPRYLLIMLMVEAFTGRKIKSFQLDDFQPDAPSVQSVSGPTQPATPAPAAPAGYGVEFESHETHYEAEQTSFSAQGVVKTTDGQEIRFSVGLSMSREHTEQSDVSLRLGEAKKQDPLVINFGGTAAELTSTRFSFDLDADGQADRVSFVGPSSGFLALDKNGDGTIGDGSELFGPATGNGFAELAAYDQDHNGWIDENDAAFTQLKVWTKDAQGNDSLSTLAQKGVGAICLGNVATPFDLKNGQNQLDGQVKTSGIYLGENGSAGTVQQIDLVV